MNVQNIRAKINKKLDEANAMAELNSMPSDEIDDLMNKYTEIIKLSKTGNRCLWND